jgi:hypothetical protein
MPHQYENSSAIVLKIPWLATNLVPDAAFVPCYYKIEQVWVRLAETVQVLLCLPVLAPERADGLKMCHKFVLYMQRR